MYQNSCMGDISHNWVILPSPDLRTTIVMPAAVTTAGFVALNNGCTRAMDAKKATQVFVQCAQQALLELIAH